MRKISDITKREIFELFQYGFNVEDMFDMPHETYPLYIIYSLYFCINIQHQSVE